MIPIKGRPWLVFAGLTVSILLFPTGVVSGQGSSHVNPQPFFTKSGNITAVDLESTFHAKRTKIPFDRIGLSRFTDSMVTFILPSPSPWKYVSVAGSSGNYTAYLFNNLDGRYVAYSHSILKGEFVSFSDYRSGNNTVITRTSIKMFVTALPGGYNDPTVSASQSVTVYDNAPNHAEIGYVLTDATFNYVLGGAVTGVSGIGSTTIAYNGYGVCTSTTEVYGSGSTLATVQENGEGILCLLFASDWWAGWPAVALNSLTGTITYNSSPYWASGVQAGCGCGFSFPAPSF